MNIILIGFMGSGKSSIAKEIASRLKLQLFEMDEMVFQKTETTTMDEVFAKGGEALLRETEIAISKEYASLDNHVISTGGGVVLNKSILDNLRGDKGKIFYLNASFLTISIRLAENTSRPLFKNLKEAESLYHMRKPLYLKYADHVVEVDQKSIEEVTQEIIEEVYGR